jgi:hypothetical protein
VAESIVHKVDHGLTAEQVESFKENGFLGSFDLYAEDEAPLRYTRSTAATPELTL